MSVVTLPIPTDMVPESWEVQLSRPDLNLLDGLVRSQTKLLHDYLLWCESLHDLLGRQYAASPTCTEIETSRACQRDLEGMILDAERGLGLTPDLKGFLRRHRTNPDLRDLLYAAAEAAGVSLPSNRCTRRSPRRR